MSNTYREANSRSLQRLVTLVSVLRDEDLARPMRDGWTVAAVLAHLAFWDQRVLGLIRRWKAEGVGRSPIDVDNVNDALKPLCLAIPGREAALLALDAAKGVDADLERLPDSLMPEILELVEAGKFRLNRALHRDEHLDQIEGILARQEETCSDP